MKKVFLVLVLSLAGLFPAPAWAGHMTDTPYVEWPVHRAAQDTGPNIDVVLVGPRNLRGMRKVATNVDRRVDGLRIHSRVGIRCRDIPNSRCVHVFIANYGRSGWLGRTFLDRHPVVLKINTYYNSRGHYQFVAGHEFMHVLGLTHHRSRGLCDINDYSPMYAAPDEIAAFRREF